MAYRISTLPSVAGNGELTDEFLCNAAGTSKKTTLLKIRNGILSSSDYLPAGTGAVVTTVEGKLRERVTPLDFGAKGDGSDDTAAIVAALAHIKAVIDANDWINQTTADATAYVEFDGLGMQYAVSSQIVIGNYFIGMYMHGFTFSALDTFEANTGTLTIDHATGYITMSGVIRAILKIGEGNKSAHHDNIFENIFFDCRHKCDGLTSRGTSTNRFTNVVSLHHKRIGLRWYGSDKNTEAFLTSCQAYQWGWAEAVTNEATAVGIAIESADMMSTFLVANNNAVNVYLSTWGSHAINLAHVYNHHPDSADTTLFPEFLIAVASGVDNTTATGKKIKVTTKTAHGLTTGNLIYVGWMPGISSDAAASTGKWSTVTVIDAVEFDCDQTTFAGTYAPETSPSVFAVAGTTITYTGDDALKVDDRVSFTTTGLLPANIALLIKYYVKAVTTSGAGGTFTIALTKGGTAITFDDAGTGVHTTINRTWNSRVRVQEKQPIGIWLAPDVQACWLDNIQLDGTTLRSYTTYFKATNFYQSASSEKQRTSYPWMDIRVLEADSALDGLHINQVTTGDGSAPLSLYAQGMGSIAEPVNCCISNILSLAGNAPNTRAYAYATFSTEITKNSPTGYVGATTYTGTITIDGTPYALSFLGSEAATLQELVNYIGSQTDGWTYGWVNSTLDRLSVYNIVNQEEGATITIAGNMFTSLTGFAAIPTPVASVIANKSYVRAPVLTHIIAYKGTSSTCGISFSGLNTSLNDGTIKWSQKTGWYSPAGDVIAEVTNGVVYRTIDASGRSIWGGTTSVAVNNVHCPLQIQSTTASASENIMRFAADASGPLLFLCKSRNTTIGDTTSATGVLSDGDDFGTLVFGGNTSDDDTFKSGTTIRAEVDGSYTSTARKGKIVFSTTSSVNPVDRVTIDSLGNVTLANAALATTATAGFPYIPSCAGAPTGVPTTKTGLVPLIMDSTNNRLYAYIGGVWKSTLFA